MFKKGGKPGPGRPQGSKTKSYLNASLWLQMAYDDIQDMEPKDRLHVIQWAVEQILAKVQVLPATPGDSVSNGLAAFQLMNGLSAINPPLDPNPSANGGASQLGA